MASQTWLIVEVCDSIFKSRPLGEGVTLLYVVSPRLEFTEESRSVDEVVSSAADKGFECRFCNEVQQGVNRRTWWLIKNKLLGILREKLGKNVREHDVSINSVAAMVKYT